MVVKIRLQRFGQKKVPFYHIVVANARTARQSKPLEKLGTYDPIPKDGVKYVDLNIARTKYWIGVGAQPTETAARILEKADLLLRPPKHVSNRPRGAADHKFDLVKALEGSVLAESLKVAYKSDEVLRRVGPRRG